MAFAVVNSKGSERGVPVHGMILASGQSRDIYSLSNHPDLLVKIPKPSPAPRRFFTKYALLRKMRRAYKQVIPLRRELREYERVATEGPLTDKHLQNCAGLVRTEKGVGIAVRPVRKSDGDLALTLQQVIDAGQYDARIHSALIDFFRWFVSSKIVAADVHLGNIVLNEDDNSFVLVDGIGDKTFLPLRAWLPALNRHYKVRLAQTLSYQVAIHFMNSSFKKQVLVAAVMMLGTAFGIDMMDGELIDG